MSAKSAKPKAGKKPEEVQAPPAKTEPHSTSTEQPATSTKEVQPPLLFGEFNVSPEVVSFIGFLFRLALIVYFCWQAYSIRIYAIQDYGLVIHEFDPWFNYRATEYLEQHGWTKFFTWFDYMSWYPLGRPVGTTIYPGMQITSVFLYRVFNAAGYEISLNDVCCYVPAWFGVVATLFLAMLTYECYGSANAAVFAAGIMAIIPAHTMRSVGGGYDNNPSQCLQFVLLFIFG